MQDLLFLFLSSVLMPVLVNVVSHVLEMLFDKWLGNWNHRRHKLYKRNSKRHHKRR